METPLPSPPPLELPDRKNNRAAKAAGACAIGSIMLHLIGLGLSASEPSLSGICGWIDMLACLAGIILGIIGLVQIQHHPGQRSKGWAITGIVIGVLRIFIIPVFSVLSLLVPTIGDISMKINGTLTAP
ncbi:MAG: DUF4190 domain-containing protein [Anaerolineales bacterium]|jgi:uncharacterized membrane protein